MSIISNYDNFFLPAGDMGSAKEFYQDKLGLDVKFDFSEKGMVAFKVGNNEPAIILRKDQNVKPAIWFTVDNVHQAYNQLKEKGIHFLSEPFEIHTGFSVEFNDPFGNRLGLTDYTKLTHRGQEK
jgi:predicted enzyme related to lactoylglutathione lyase